MIWPAWWDEWRRLQQPLPAAKISRAPPGTLPGGGQSSDHLTGKRGMKVRSSLTGPQSIADRPRPCSRLADVTRLPLSPGAVSPSRNISVRPSAGSQNRIISTGFTLDGRTCKLRSQPCPFNALHGGERVRQGQLAGVTNQGPAALVTRCNYVGPHLVGITWRIDHDRCLYAGRGATSSRSSIAPRQTRPTVNERTMLGPDLAGEGAAAERRGICWRSPPIIMRQPRSECHSRASSGRCRTPSSISPPPRADRRGFATPRTDRSSARQGDCLTMVVSQPRGYRLYPVCCVEELIHSRVVESTRTSPEFNSGNFMDATVTGKSQPALPAKAMRSCSSRRCSRYAQPP